MLDKLLGGILNAEQQAKDKIEDALERIAIELECRPGEFFVMIKPKNDEFEFGLHIYKLVGGIPKLVREITLAEILQ